MKMFENVSGSIIVTTPFINLAYLYHETTEIY